MKQTAYQMILILGLLHFFLITVVGLILVLGSKFITHVSVDALRTVCSTSKGRIVHSLDHFVAENAVVFRDGALTHHL